MLFTNAEAEESLIRTVLCDSGAWAQVSFLEPEQFESEVCRSVWRSLHARKGRADPDLVRADLGQDVPFLGGRTGDPRSLAEIVAECHANRGVRRALSFGETLFLPQEPQLKAADRIERLQQELSRVLVPKGIVNGLIEGGKVWRQELEFYRHSPEGVPGFSLGFPDLDRLTGGLRPGELMTVASNTGEGKSILVGQMACHLAQQGHKVAFFGLEMAGDEMFGRLVCARANLSVEQMKRPGPRELALIEEANDWVDQQIVPNFVFVDANQASSLTGIVYSATYLARQEDAKVLIVDYLQHVQTRRRDKRTEEIGDIVQRLKLLASELKVAVIAVSQMNRETAKDNAGRGSLYYSLAESASVERESNFVALLWRPAAHLQKPAVKQHWSDIALLDLAKGRRTGPGLCLLRFDGARSRFDSLDQETKRHLLARLKDLEVKRRKEDD